MSLVFVEYDQFLGSKSALLSTNIVQYLQNFHEIKLLIDKNLCISYNIYCEFVRNAETYVRSDVASLAFIKSARCVRSKMIAKGVPPLL